MTSGIVKTTFEELFDANRLPSGFSFKLMPDTVEVALAVGEVNEKVMWKRKAIEAFTVVDTINSLTLHGPDSPGPEFIHGMLDIDVVFLGLAWTAQINGMSIKLADGVPCPSCGTPFMEIPFGQLAIWGREEPLTGPQAIVKIDKSDFKSNALPPTISNGDLYMSDPTWRVSRHRVSEQSWSKPEVISIHRALAGLRYSSADSGSPRALSYEGEAKKISAGAVSSILRQMDKFVPHFHTHFELKCKHCEEVAEVPFDQGL